MDERDDLGDVWSQHERGGYEQARSISMDTIASFVAPMTRRGGGGRRIEPPAPLAPTVPLYKWHSQCHTDYLSEKLRDVDASSSVDDGDTDLDAVARRDREREFGEERSDPPTEQPSSQENYRRQRERSDSSQSGERRERHRSYVGECFLCGWGDEFHDGIEAPHVNYMKTLIKTCYGVYSNLDLAIALHEYFKAEVYDESRMSMLTVPVALEHIEGLHTLDAGIFLGESIRDEKRIAFLLKNMIFRADGTYDKQALADYHSSVSHIKGLYNTRLVNMNFNNGNTKEDQRHQAAYFTLRAPRSNRDAQRKRQERVEKARQLPPIRLT